MWMMKTKKQIAEEAKQIADVLATTVACVPRRTLRQLALLIHDLAHVAEIEGAATKPIRKK